MLATIKGMNGHPRVSAYTLQKAILTVFRDLKLFPAGIYADIPAVQSWALKYGVALKKLGLRRVHPYIRGYMGSGFKSNCMGSRFSLSELRFHGFDGWCDDRKPRNMTNSPRWRESLVLMAGGSYLQSHLRGRKSTPVIKQIFLFVSIHAYTLSIQHEIHA